MTLAQAAEIGACLLRRPESAEKILGGVASPQEATETDLIFLTDPKYRAALKESKAAACVVEEKWLDYLPKHMEALVSDNPYLAYARIATALFPPHVPAPDAHPLACVDASAVIREDCAIEPFAVIDAGVRVGKGSIVGSHCRIGKGVHIGDRARIGAGCVISCAVIGDDVEMLPGARIGQDGFGFATDRRTGRHVSVPQLGIVRIGHRVSIGSNTTIDRGALGDTIIEDDARIDNLVQIGHNVRIGKGAVIVAQVGVAGSSHVGAYAQLGGQVGVAGHLRIGEGARVAAQSGVATDLAPGAAYGGAPAEPIVRWHRKNSWLTRMATQKRKQDE